jgi:PASTA domain
MPPAPAAPKRKAVDLAHPGPREYLIFGGAALAAGLIYLWWKNRQAAPAAAAADNSSQGATSPTGILTAWFHDHAGGNTTTTTTAGTVTVPDVVGKRVNTAIAELRAAGFGYKSGSGSRNPKLEYTVTAQSPAGGTKAPAGSVVTLDFKTASPAPAPAGGGGGEGEDSGPD